nr:DUF1385 domain-containing protein [Clostridia bacterium]
MSKKTCTPKGCSRLNKVGGQAVLEGVMMKAGERTVTSCRKEDGSIVVTDSTFVSIRKRKKILNLPILRGFVNFIEMMALSVRTLNISAEALGIEDEQEKAKKEKARAEGKRAAGTLDIVMVLGVVLGLLLSVGLFFVLPSLISDGISWLYTRFISESGIGIVGIAFIEGLVKIAIFLTYLSLVILMPDIRRTFMYHGAEHKSIACFEAGEELTPENAMKHRRFHPRCGTSFMFLMILIGIFIGIFVRFILPPEEAFPFVWLYSLCVSGIKILLLPITMGIGYEILMLAGKHDNIFTRIISAPGMWVQRLTTKEPTEDMLEVAITSIKCALRDEYPEFREFFENEGWKKEPELEVEIVCEEADSECAEAADCVEGEVESSPETNSEPEVADCEPEKVNPTEDEDDA